MMFCGSAWHLEKSRVEEKLTEKLTPQVSFNILRTAALSTLAFHKSQISISSEAYRKRITRNANARKRISGEESTRDEVAGPSPAPLRMKSNKGNGLPANILAYCLAKRIRIWNAGSSNGPPTAQREPDCPWMIYRDGGARLGSATLRDICRGCALQ